MNEKQKLTALFLALGLFTSSAAPAHAHAPTSQFGFKGWPYRQSSGCVAPDNGWNDSIKPSQQPEVSCTPSVTPSPTPVPEATAIPSATPVPTAAPAATKAPQSTQKPAAATVPPSTDDDYTTPSITVQEENAFLLLNQDRKAHGRSALKLDPTLCEIARIKSRDMHENRYFAHTSPTYGSVSDMLRHFGYSFVSAGENIAHHATIEKSQAAFMSSDGHRRNILGTQWTKAGVGVWTDDQGFVYVTQIFAR